MVDPRQLHELRAPDPFGDGPGLADRNDPIARSLQDQGWGLDQGYFANAFRIVVFDPAYASAYRITAHQACIQGPQQTGNAGRIGDAWVKPLIVIFRPENAGHAVMNAGHQRVGPGGEDAAGFEDPAIGRRAPALP